MIARLKERDPAAFIALYDKYAPALYTVVLQIVKDEEMASDVLANVFIHIISKVETYNDQFDGFFIWMFKIARNAAINVIRSQNEYSSKDFMNKSSEKIEALQLDNYGLKKAIMKLQDEQRKLLTLCYYKGYTHDEAAKALNISVEAVNVKLKAALLELRAALI